MPLAHFSMTVFAIRALAISNGQLGIADGVNCPAMWAVKTIAMAEFPSSMHLPTADRASVPINLSTFAQIGACLPAAPHRSRSLLGIRVRMPWPGIRECGSWHPLPGLPVLACKIFESAEWFRCGMSRRAKLNIWHITGFLAHAHASGHLVLWNKRLIVAFRAVITEFT